MHAPTAIPSPRWRESVRRFLLVALAALLVPGANACAPRVSAQVPHDWQFRGEIVAMGDSTIRVRYKTGEVYSLALDEQTVYVRNKQPASKALLRVGTRVDVDVHSQDTVNRAVRIQIVFGAARSAASP